MTVGERIRAARERAGLTQQQLGQRLGEKTFQNVSNWERGRRNPKAETLRKISEAIGCPLSELTHGLVEGMRDEGQMRVIVEQQRLIWKGNVYEKIRAHDFAGARDKLAVLQGVEFLAEALELMEGNMNGRFALADLIADAEAAYILSQEGE